MPEQIFNLFWSYKGEVSGINIRVADSAEQAAADFKREAKAMLHQSEMALWGGEVDLSQLKVRCFVECTPAAT